MKYINTLILICYTLYASAGTYSKPVSFTPNLGQVTNITGEVQHQVLATASLKGVNWYLTNTGITYVFLAYTEVENTHPVFDYQKKYEVQYSRVDVELKGAVIQPASIVYNEAFDWKTKHLNANNPIDELKHYKSVTVKNVYPNIDWVWKSTPEGLLEYEFVVHPGGDYTKIEMHYQHAQLSNEGNYLNMETAVGTVREGELKVYSGTQAVDASFTVNEKENTVRFAVGTYDEQKILRIDPPLALLWSNQYGGNFADGFRGVASHSSGAYICGYSMSLNFPTAFAGPGTYFNGTFSGVSDAVLMKTIGADTIAWSVYMGGAGDDYTNSIATDSTGNIYVTGAAETGFPIVNRPGAYNEANTADKCAYLAMFNTNLELIWSTFIGSNQPNEISEALRVKVAFGSQPGVVGFTNSANFPTTATNMQLSAGGGDDAFFVVFSDSGQFVYSSIYGGSDNDYFTSFATDTGFLLSGYTGSLNVLSCDTPKGGIDGMFVSLTSDLVFENCFRIGGSSDDFIYDMVSISPFGLALCGKTNSTDFPVIAIPGIVADSANGLDDAFVMRLVRNPIGGFNNVWSTHLGGSLNDALVAIDFNGAGLVYATGFTNSSDLPHTPSIATSVSLYHQPNLGGAYDGLIASYSLVGLPVWVTYKGDTCLEFAADIVYDTSRHNFYIVGEGLTQCNTCQPYVSDTTYGNSGSYSLVTDGVLWMFETGNSVSGGGGGSAGPCDNFIAQNRIVDSYCPDDEVSLEPPDFAGGVYPVAYSWSTGSNQYYSGLVPTGTYTVTITDALGCTISATSEMNDIEAPYVFPDVEVIMPHFCVNAPGVIRSLYPGTEMVWITPTDTLTIMDEFNVSPGVYLLQSLPNCDADSIPFIYEVYEVYTIMSNDIPLTLESNIINVCNLPEAELYLDSPVGMGNLYQPLSYQWSDGSSTSHISVTTSGNYYVSVTDMVGCTFYDQYYVDLPPQFDYNYNLFPEHCENEEGYIEVIVSNSTYFDVEGSGVHHYPAGTHTHYIVEYNYNCVYPIVFTMPSFMPVQATYAATPILCAGGTSQVSINAQGGQPPYWGAETLLLEAGQYVQTVVDDLGCEFSLAIDIDEPEYLEMDLDTVSAVCGQNYRVVNVYAYGGTPPYTGSGSITVSNTGLHTFVVTDANNCAVSQTLTMNIPELPTQITLSTDTICRFGTVHISASGNYDFTWQPFGFQTDSFTYSNVIQSTPIIVTGVDANGCITSDTAFLNVRNCAVSNVNNDVQPFGVKLMPNPANTSLVVMVEEPNYMSSWKVFSIEGKLMAADAVDFSSMLTIDVQMFAEGVYLIQLQTDAGSVVSRFMVQH